MLDVRPQPFAFEAKEILIEIARGRDEDGQYTGGPSRKPIAKTDTAQATPVAMFLGMLFQSFITQLCLRTFLAKSDQ